MNPTIPLLAFCIAAETVEQLLYRSAGRATGLALRFLAPAVGLHLVGFVVWLVVLRSLPLGIALPLTALTNVTIALGARIVFGERVNRRRWLGIGLVMAGFILVASR